MKKKKYVLILLIFLLCIAGVIIYFGVKNSTKGIQDSETVGIINDSQEHGNEELEESTEKQSDLGTSKEEECGIDFENVEGKSATQESTEQKPTQSVEQKTEQNTQQKPEQNPEQEPSDSDNETEEPVEPPQQEVTDWFGKDEGYGPVIR